MRPKTLDDFAGQKHLIGEGKPIRKMIENNSVFSMVFWGPPGVGKTTLALIIANSVNAEFIQLSAVSSGVKDVRAAIEKAEINQKHLSRKTILFIDEIHRFNKAQQDSLLHSVESGVITLIGATTENPSFEVISPLLSRCRVYVLEDLSEDELMLLADNALTKDAELKDLKIDIQDKKLLLQFSGGDARRLLNGLDLAVRSTPPEANGIINITNDVLKEAYQKNYIRYDKDAEEHYNIISAFIKSIRGSDPDAAVYWLARMLKGGEEPKFIARRMVVLASEDIGNADPYGLTMATSAFTAIDYIGMPEAQLVLAQAATYLASAPKSNASYRAIMSAKEDVELTGELGVPLHLRNAPTKLMKSLDYGKEYKYSHDYEGHFTEQQYLPEELKDKVYYKPTGIGEEAKILERLKNWWKNKKR
ncbi:MAG TPA: replication-associated recombination protein A [Ignavibacteria bacterium]|nr:replication-associated recombination protein A [Ignavibacteria bacterium]HRF64645.1 replication-associated recombination protein A [Ignavibacteria bacterium]HRJ04961.1 replication-associated recombination protein A [Ignavibacteria bacterium]HRJ86404.1 replication-associated recombination protein A [Ignavibacteria bacterium]